MKSITNIMAVCFLIVVLMGGILWKGHDIGLIRFNVALPSRPMAKPLVIAQAEEYFPPQEGDDADADTNVAKVAPQPEPAAVVPLALQPLSPLVKGDASMPRNGHDASEEHIRIDGAYDDAARHGMDDLVEKSNRQPVRYVRPRECVGGIDLPLVGCIGG